MQLFFFVISDSLTLENWHSDFWALTPRAAEDALSVNSISVHNTIPSHDWPIRLLGREKWNHAFFTFHSHLFEISSFFAPKLKLNHFYSFFISLLNLLNFLWI